MAKIAIKFWELKFAEDWKLVTSNPNGMFTYSPESPPKQVTVIPQNGGNRVFTIGSNGNVRMIGDVAHIDEGIQ